MAAPSLKDTKHRAAHCEARKVFDDAMYVHDDSKSENTCAKLIGRRIQLFQNGYFCRGPDPFSSAWTNFGSDQNLIFWPPPLVK